MKRFFLVIIFLALCFDLSACKKELPQNAKVDWYLKDYDECLNMARGRSEYVHTTMQEDALGKTINNCMSERGWAPGGDDLN